MARITLRQLLDHAAEHGYGVPAFNINNMEQGLAIMDAASSLDAPVIIQASRGARSYANDIMLKHMMDAVTEIYPQIPVCVHLDHGNGPDTCMTAIQAGFTSVMMDGSLKADGKTAADWDYNVGVTKTVTSMAHLGGISVEGELGVLGSLEHGGGEQMRGGMPKDLQRVRIFRSEDGNLGVALERAREVHQLAIGAGDESFFCEARRNLVRNLRSGGTALHFASGAVRQRDLNGFSAHTWCFAPVETASLLADADAVKADNLEWWVVYSKDSTGATPSSF